MTDRMRRGERFGKFGENVKRPASAHGNVNVNMNVQ
jgi:hypothetical protein